jgi:hypothetical protein
MCNAQGRFWPRLCQNTHGRNGVSESFTETRTSVASFRILGVKLKTRCLYASSGNGVEGFYTGSADSCLMHCSTTAGCRKAPLDGGNQP